MNIEDNIKIQQAFVQARIEYAAAEEERQKKIKEKAHAALIIRQQQAAERKALIDRIKSDPERMKKWRVMLLRSQSQNTTYNLEVVTMEEMNIKTLASGKYAMQRRSALESNSPEEIERMQEDGTLEEHLAYVQECVSNYVDICVDRYKQTEEYKQAEAADPMEAMRLLNMTVLEAEEAAYRSWIAIDAYEEEDDE